MLILLEEKTYSSHRKIVASVGHTQILEIFLFFIPFIITILALCILVG